MRRPIVFGSLPLLFAACADHGSGGSAPLAALGTVAFESRTEIATGVARTSAALLVDVDRDGRPDLVAVDGDGHFAVRLNQGQGVYATGEEHAVDPGAFHLSAGDLDFDGDLDLVCASSSGRADVLTNDGQGSFAITGTVQLGAGPVAATLAHVTDDDVLDLVVLHENAPDVLVFEGIGDGNFVSPQGRPFDRSAQVTGLSAGDLDGDGKAEIVVCDLLRGVVTILPGHEGAPVQLALDGRPVASAIGDVDADGIPEVVVALLDGHRIDVLAAQGGGYVVRRSIPTAGQPYAPLVDDVDGDGIADLVYTLLDRHAVAWHRNVRGLLVDDAELRVTTGSAFLPQLGDVDGDGARDLFVPAFGAPFANLYPGSGAGPRGGRLFATEGVASPELVTAADLDGDGRADVLAASFESTVVSISELIRDAEGRASLAHRISVDVGLRVQNVVPADLDADGRVDFVVAVEGGIRLIHNRPPVANLRYAFEVLPTGDVLAPGAGPFEVVVRDLDLDGALDLVVAYHEADQVALLRGTATPFEFEVPQTTRLTGRPVGVTTGDFDGDGRPDVAVGRLSFATVTTFHVTAAGLVAHGDTPVGAGPFYLRTADFDRDGRDDVVLSEVGTESVRLLLADGTGTFRSTELAAGPSPTALLVRDLDRDGRTDIVVASLIGADFRVLLGDGEGGVARSLAFPGVYSALSAALADLDGDGLEDLVVGSLEARGVAWFPNVSREN